MNPEKRVGVGHGPSNQEKLENLREAFKQKAQKYEQFYIELHNETWRYFLPEGVLTSALAATRYGDEKKRYEQMLRAQTWEAVRFANAYKALDEQYKEGQRALGVQDPESLPPTQLSSILDRGEQALADNYFGEDNELLKRKSAWNEL